MIDLLPRTAASRRFLGLVACTALCAPAATLHAQSVSAERRVHLHFATFDPATDEVAVPELLRSRQDTKLWIVQFDGLPSVARRQAVTDRGVQLHGYLPENSYVARASFGRAQTLKAVDGVRSTTPYHPAFRLEPALIQELLRGEDVPKRRYNIVVVDKKTDKPSLIGKIARVGGAVDDEQAGSVLLEATLTRAQLLRVARFDEVLWIDRWTPIELDMDNARFQGGGNHVERMGSYTGKGINGHVYEGVEATHVDFNNRPVNVRSSGARSSHGHCTAGIVFGNGKSNPAGRGMAPDAQPFYTTYSSVQGSRWQVVDTLVKTHKVMFTTASWGNARTTQYTSVSMDTDDIIFDHDMPWTQSQSNAGNQNSRPQAWAKNIFSIGGVRHRNNSNPLDDTWSGGGSTGPAADGRIKPDLCAYYDGILCSDLTGSAGYNRNASWYASFGGTSGATPIVAGHNAIAIQMFTDGLFSPQRVKNGTRWQNKPHFTTLKALQIANARQYAFTKTSTDNKREHCGWGFPNLKTMYDNRKLHYVVDETDILKQGDGMEYTLTVANNQPELKVSMCYADLPANPSARLTRVNDLTLRVVAPNGTKYWGNRGLTDGNYSVSGGTNDVRDTVENVFIRNPQAGVWKIEVVAFLVAKDSHIETRAVDADFGLVSVGGTFRTKRRITTSIGSFSTYGQGCPSSTSCVPCFTYNWTKTSANQTTSASRVAILDVQNSKEGICGVSLFMRSKTGAVDVNVEIWDATINVDPKSRVARTKIRVGTKLDTYYAAFTNRPKHDVYFVVIDNADKLILPTSRTGTLVLHREFANSKWSDWNATTNWQFRVHCDRGANVPALTATGKPVLNELIQINLGNVNPTTPAAFFLGGSNSKWNGINLPWTYAPGCSVLASGDIVLGTVTNGSGQASVPLKMPNDRRLIGALAYTQFLVADKANRIGFIASNGGTIKLGEF